MRRECRERFPRHRSQRKPLVNDPGMHHGTCVTHVSWCMTGSLNSDGGENVPGIPGACATLNFMYLARGPLRASLWSHESINSWPSDDIWSHKSGWALVQAMACLYSERPRGAGFRSVNPTERWRENPARALARAGFSQHLECGIHRSESSPEGSFALIPRPVARWAKTTP